MNTRLILGHTHTARRNEWKELLTLMRRDIFPAQRRAPRHYRQDCKPPGFARVHLRVAQTFTSIIDSIRNVLMSYTRYRPDKLKLKLFFVHSCTVNLVIME